MVRNLGSNVRRFTPETRAAGEGGDFEAVGAAGHLVPSSARCSSQAMGRRVLSASRFAVNSIG